MIKTVKGDIIEKETPKSKKRRIISIIAILAVALLVGGYYYYQLNIIPKLTKLDVPTFSYPQQSVFYSYKIGTDNLSAVFGDQKMSSTKLTSELVNDMKNIKADGFDGIKLTYTFQFNNYLADRISLKAAQQGLYPIGDLIGDFRHRAFDSDEMTNWQSFVRETVDANKNYIYFWDVWNEPSLDMFKYGSPEEYVQLLKATYPVIKEANPNAKVVVTLSAEGHDNTGFEDQVMALGGGDYFDVLSIHPYGANPYLQENLIKESIAREQILVAKYNNKWPLVIGEIGEPASEVSEAEQTKLAVMLYTEAAKNNIPVTWFYWSDQRIPKNAVSGDGYNWGLIRYDGTARPILDAIKPFLKPNQP